MVRRLAALYVVLSSVAFAQAPEFDAASVKLKQPDGRDIEQRMGPVSVSLSGTLRHLVTLAYDTNDLTMTGGPSWMATDC
jgi:uncharacterized protein (TIGR03435 family)